MKTIVCILNVLVLLYFGNGQAQCTGPVFLSSQAEVDSFAATYANCEIINGDLKIMFGSDITTLEPLSGITAVQGFLDIYGNPNLSTLSGLQNITSVGSLRISNNGGLTGVSGLTSLYLVNGTMEISSNNQLQNLQGLSAITTIAGNLHIENNGQLTGMESMVNLTSIGGLLSFTNNKSPEMTQLLLPGLLTIGGNLSISGNFIQYDPDNYAGLAFLNLPMLQSIGGVFYLGNNNALQTMNLPQLTSISLNPGINGKLEIVQNASLQHLNGFSSLQYIGGALEIVQNQMLQNIDGLSGVSTLASVRISGNSSLQNILGLQGISGSLQSLQVMSNPELTSLDGLQGVTTISQTDLRISANALLNSITALNNLAFIAGDVEISDNPSLQNMGSFDNLQAIGKSLYVLNNASLTSISSFSNLNTIGGTVPPFTFGNVSLIGNASLLNLDGFQGLSQINGNLTIRQNNVLNNLNGLANINSVRGMFEFSGNTSVSNLDDLNLTILGSNIIISDTTLQNVNGLSSVTTFAQGSTPSLTLNNNANLLQIDGLSNFTGNLSALTVSGNASLININGLSGITQINTVLIQNNSDLKNLDGLSSTVNINASLRVLNNASLESIQGIRHATLQLSTNTLHIYNNPKLFICDLQNICVYRSGGRPVSIYDNGGDCYSAAISCPTTWNGSSWSNGLPSSTKSAIIAGDLNVSTELHAKNFSLNSGTVNITESGTLKLTGSIANNSDPALFTVQHGGGIIQSQASLNVGKITVNRNSIPFRRLDYALWASPVSGQNLFDFSSETINGVTNYPGSTGRIYTYEGSDGYVNPLPFNAQSVMETGKGYLFRAPNTWSQTVALSYPGVFEGIPTAGNISIATHSGNYTSIGNPYPSAINADALMSANPGVSTIYYWTTVYDENGGSTLANSYASYTVLGGTPAAPGNPVPGPIIPLGCGFIVESTTSQVLFTDVLRDTSGVSTPASTSEKHRIWLDLRTADNQPLYTILIGYMAGATNGVDQQIDGKMFDNQGSAIYSIIDNGKYGIQGRALPFDNADMVPLGFTAVAAGGYTISLNNFDGLFGENSVPIYLKDNNLNLTINLMESDYHFQSPAGDFYNRFEIVYENATLDAEKINGVPLDIITSEKSILLRSNEIMMSVELFNMQGLLVHSNNMVADLSYSISGNTTGAYLLRTTFSDGRCKTTKVLVN
jgi:hypothetical protein